MYIYLQNYMKINKKYGYVRVSSKSQELNSSLEFQKHLLIQNEIEAENIRIEVGSAVNEIKNRPTIYKVLKEHLGYRSNRLVKPEETNETK